MNMNVIKDHLVNRLAELEARADRAERHANHRDEAVSADFAEQATERENDDVLHTISHEARAEIIQLRHALDQLEAGSYGECESCGAAIAPERMAALPGTTLCVECAGKQEQ
ncbi:MAG: TraR/DksA family transcriptional regulator [Oceanobacter sp.]